MTTDPKPAIWTDPDTGLKCFNTRATPPRNPAMYRSGYRVTDDQQLKVLPTANHEARFDREARAKYREHKETRVGVADYVSMSDGATYDRYVADVHSSTPMPRDSLTDSCQVLVIGAGFAGLMLWYKLKDAGFTDVRFCEQGGDVGGTWYWNRYPGIACDVESYSYLPLLEEMDYVPTMKFASGYEIFRYCQRLAERTDFYDRCLFHTSVEQTEWSDERGSWTVRTNRGDEMTARYIVLANGILSQPKLARIDGMDNFAGESFHTSRWDYSVDLSDKVVGVIGTGATAVQVIPEIAKIVRELYVFQRTPSTVDVRDQRATTPEERRRWATEAGWARARRARFAQISAGRAAMQANDDYLSGKVPDFKERKHHETVLTPEERIQKQLDSNYRIMEQIRARIDDIVQDPTTAAALKPYYPYGCKRPTFHDEYLPTFNLPHVTLVDAAPTGVRQINEHGVFHDGQEYPLDVIIYATGFSWMATSTFRMIVGRQGRTLSQKWDNGGTRTFLGIHTHDFPNMLILTGPQGGGGSFNFTDTIETHTDYVVWLLRTMKAGGHDTIEVREEDELRYAAHCRDADLATAPLRDCLSYYNNDGSAEPGSLGYYGGGEAWRHWRDEAQSTLAPFILGTAPPL